jgi:hypothetical protein
MKKNSTLALLAGLLVCSTASAQQLGISGRYGIGLLESGRVSDAWSAWCGCEDPGSALVQETLFSAAFLYGNEIWPVAAAVRFGVGTGVSRFISPAYPAAASDLPSGTDVEFREELRSLVFRFDLEGHYQTEGPVSVVLGPWLEFLVESTSERSERILSPAETTFPGGGSERSVTGPLNVDGPGARWGMALGVTYRLELTPRIDLRPHLVLEGDVDRLAASRPGALMLSAGSTVLVDIGAHGPSLPIVALPPPEAPAASPPRASVDIYALEGERRVAAATVRRDLSYRRVVAQMPRAITFAGGSHGIDSSYRRRTRDAVRHFTLGSLIGVDASELYRDALDILGMRLRATPSSRVKLVGTTAGSEPRSDGALRATSVREYLVSVWGIDRARMSVASSSIVTDVPEVRIETTSKELVAPIVVEWLDERFLIPPIGIDPAIDAPSGVRASKLQLVRNGSALAEASGVRPSTVDEIAVDLSDALRGESAAPIVATLDIVDSAGATVRAIDELPLVLPSMIDRTPDRERITLVVERCGNTSGCGDRIVDELRRILRRGARARVTVPSTTASQAPGRTSLSDVRAALDAAGATVVETPGADERIIIDIEQTPGK